MSSERFLNYFLANHVFLNFDLLSVCSLNFLYNRRLRVYIFEYILNNLNN